MAFLLYLDMRVGSAIILLCFLCWGCSSIHFTREQKQANACHQAWQYLKLEKPVKGIVLSQTTGICGYFMIPWSTVVRTTTGDTIRVLELGSRFKLAKFDSIVVNITKDSLVKGAIINTEFDCKVKRTCNGLISLIAAKKAIR